MREQYVLWLDVAMHDAMLVRALECKGDIAQDRNRARERYGALLDPVAQRHAVDERHRIERETGGLSRGEHGDDAWVLQPRGNLDLALEPFTGDVRRELWAQDFDDNASRESSLLGEKDARHPAAAELTLDGIGGSQCGLKLFLEAVWHAVTRSVRSPKLSGRSTAGHRPLDRSSETLSAIRVHPRQSVYAPST